MNGLFDGGLTLGDKLVYVNNVIKGKLMESKKLAEQAVNNTKEQFANSPDLTKEIMGGGLAEKHNTGRELAAADDSGGQGV